jgi:hypothetical protein
MKMVLNIPLLTVDPQVCPLHWSFYLYGVLSVSSIGKQTMVREVVFGCLLCKR